MLRSRRLADGACLGEIGRDRACLGEISRDRACLGEIGRDRACLGEIGRASCQRSREDLRQGRD